MVSIFSIKHEVLPDSECGTETVSVKQELQPEESDDNQIGVPSITSIVRDNFGNTTDTELGPMVKTEVTHDDMGESQLRVMMECSSRNTDAHVDCNSIINSTFRRPSKCKKNQTTAVRSGKTRLTGGRMYKCKECQAGFTSKSNLTNHFRNHKSERLFTCEECAALFSRRSYLRIHFRTHTDEKPYKCNECEASFSQHGNLILHTRIHTGEKPFKCSECEASFTNSSHLKRHFRTHTGEKPFKCNECEASFSQHGHLVDHTRTHTGEKPFKCGEC